jgi:hypothetical protein
MLSGEYRNKHQYGPLPHVMHTGTRYQTPHVTHVKTQAKESARRHPPPGFVPTCTVFNIPLSNFLLGNMIQKKHIHITVRHSFALLPPLRTKTSVAIMGTITRAL